MLAPRRPRPFRLATSACAAALLALGAGMPAALAQTPSVFDGRTFQGINLPSPLQPLTLHIRANRAWTWREESTERLFVERDVHVTLGPYTFRARRATLWMEPIRLDGQDAEQLALYLEEVSDPTGASA